MNVDTDFVFILGLLMGALAFPTLLSAFSEGRAPRLAALLIVMSISMISFAALQRPTGYTLAEVPQVFERVVRSVAN